MSPIKPPQDAIDTVNEGQLPDGIRLPFPVSYARWVNGEARNKKNADVTYFGGWAISADQFEAQTSILGSAPLSYFKKETLTNDAGAEYEAYVSRFVIAAEICKRERWIPEKNTSHVQGVCMLAEVAPDKKSYLPWGAIVLTAKGHAGLHIKRAFQEWATITAAGRREWASNAPAWTLYAIIGTFGNEFKSIEVGKTTRRTITPCQCGKPTVEIDEAFITKYYVGDETLLKMAELSKQSREWQAAWAKDKPTGAYASDEAEPPEEPPFNAEDVPF